MDEQLTQLEIEFLDKNGYLLLENVLDSHQIKEIKTRISQIQKDEGTRAGDIRTSVYRNRLIEENTLWSKFKLKINDLSFKILRKSISFLRNRSMLSRNYFTCIALLRKTTLNLKVDLKVI